MNKSVWVSLITGTGLALLSALPAAAATTVTVVATPAATATATTAVRTTATVSSTTTRRVPPRFYPSRS